MPGHRKVQVFLLTKPDFVTVADEGQGGWTMSTNELKSSGKAPGFPARSILEVVRNRDGASMFSR